MDDSQHVHRLEYATPKSTLRRPSQLGNYAVDAIFCFIMIVPVCWFLLVTLILHFAELFSLRGSGGPDETLCWAAGMISMGFGVIVFRAITRRYSNHRG